MPELLARHYRSGESLRLTWTGAAITRVQPTGDAAADLPVVAPALLDIQVNGYGGLNFARPENLGTIARTLARFGVARFCPTVVTGAEEVMAGALAAIAEALDQDPALRPAVPGIHVEGPYISPLDGPRGAHPRAHVRAPDWEHFSRLQDAARGRIRLLTLAPELLGAAAFIERATAAGITVAMGHTAAEAEAIHRAIAAGARLSTHLGNGLAASIDRHRNPIWPQLAAKSVWASFIADGEHLPSEALCAMVAAKGRARSILVSDSVAEAGLPPGRYTGVGGGEVEVHPGGRISLAGTPYLAGSGAHLAHCVGWAVSAGAATLPEALDMAARNPAAALGLPVPELAPGAAADLLLLRPGARGPLDVLLTVRAGEVVHDRRGEA